MKVSRHFNVTVILALLVAALTGSSQGKAHAGFEHQTGAAEMAALGSAFTYQGQLKQDGTPVEGNCDFQFILWDASIGGSQVGSILEMPGLAVSNGFFTASLDFGGGAFNGQARWLEVSVRYPAGSGSYTSLGRQPLTPAPYSLYSLTADQLDGQHGSFYQDISNMNAGTLDNELFSAYENLDEEGYLENAADGLAQNNGTLQSTLNADLLDGQDSAYYQRRVSGTCTVGSAIRSINADGTVECGQSAAGFSRNPVDMVGNVGDYTSVTTGNDGLALISYYDSNNKDLKVAHCNNLACSNATISLGDVGEDVGWFTSITIGGDGLGLISYFDKTNGNLKVVHCTNTACTSSINYNVDSSVNDVGLFTSITIGGDGFGLISYYDMNNSDLKVAHCTNATCSGATITTVDSGGSVGYYTSITIGGDGFGLISYYDATNGNLKVAHCANTACTSSINYTVDSSANDVGYYTSITTGSDGFGLISYLDYINQDLKVAHCTNAACSSATITTVDSSADNVGQYTSITTGSDGFGLISYYDQTNGNLKVAHCDDVACYSASKYILDSNGTVGYYTSITIGSDGLGLISYYDVTNFDLKVAHCDDVWCAP